MRIAVNIVGGMAALLTAGAVGLWAFERGRDEVAVTRSIQALRRLEQQVRLRAATSGEGLNARGWPATVDPGWFGDDPPLNPLVTPGRAWVEVAPPEHAALAHPQIRGAVNSGLAAFWYNPNTGVVRARVPMRLSDRETVALYNRVNSTHVSEVIDTTPIPPPPVAGDAEKSDDESMSPLLPAKVEPTGSRAGAGPS